MCQGYPLSAIPYSALAEADRPTTRTPTPDPPRYSCQRCGGTLFGNLNENCAECNAASTVPALIPFPLPSIAAGEALGLSSGGGGDFAGGGATGSFGD